ncbi:MAG: hypothetical protein WCW47_03115 [Candidatus Paceibacterota bacterium]|jgi:hypothetical protein
MASLLSSMTGTEINSTLQILSEHEVTTKDTEFFRKYRKVFARSVADAFRLGRRLYEIAIGVDQDAAYDALRQLQQIGDLEIFKEIYRNSLLSAVWVAVIEHIARVDQNEAFHLIRLHSEPARDKASLAGARRLSEFYLQQLCGDPGSPTDLLERKRKIVAQVRAERATHAVKRTESDRHRADRD